MWLRHALKLISLLIILSACSSPDRHAVDKLNSQSYAYHYRNLDSTSHYAREALKLSADYADGQAEAYNNLAFVSIVKMRYNEAQAQLDSAVNCTNNQLEQLVSYIQYMRLCQRQSRNREFYDYHELASQALNRLNEDRQGLSQRQLARLLYAESEMAIVVSTYYYYVGLERQSVEAIKSIDTWVESDTAQWMNYLYNVGAGGVITQGTHEDIQQQEFHHLLRCYMLARRYSSPFFAANALEAMAEHLSDEDSRILLLGRNMMSIDYLMPPDVSVDQLPIYLAENALRLFTEYGDVYQTSGAHRTLASCYWAKANDEQALYHLECALSDTTINQAPDLVASIREQLSVVYAALNDKAQSDFNRNLYLDLQEQTRQDRSLEARAAQLDATVSQLNKLLIIVFVSLCLMLLAIRLLVVYHKRSMQRQNEVENLKEERDEVEELLARERLDVRENERRNMEQRAKISMVNNITPLIDRILHEVKALEQDADGSHSQERLEYIRELTDTINEQNDVLTHWIQLRQGQLKLHVESFPLQPLFDVIARSQRSFQLKGVTLNVEPTPLSVKADRVLTLFMLNTLADNARKFTNEGGTVTVSAKEQGEYVELSVADTGIGMDEEALSHVFDHKLSGGHGFGLLNCRGIIEKYKKTSQLFAQCLLSAESAKGQGSRFFFRLPKGRKLLALLLLFVNMGGATMQAQTEDMLLQKASSYADSAYYSNVDGEYEQTLCFADTCRNYLNAYYKHLTASSSDTLRWEADVVPVLPELNWLHSGVKLNYNIILRFRNETAVAALALHDWSLYAYNNRIYTSLFKELSADNTLNDYCRKMQQSQTNRTVAIVLLVIMFLVVLLAVVFQLSQAMGRKAEKRQQEQDKIDLLRDELKRLELEKAKLHVSNQVLDNCLSTLKHETMYYPSRIQQLMGTPNSAEALNELVGYYRDLYGILSEQANRQMAGTRLKLSKLEHNILGDENMIAYLFDILRKLSGQKELVVHYESTDAEYVVCRVEMPNVEPTNFMPSINNIPYLICRQIVREHGEATGRRGCGIRADYSNQFTTIVINLPKQLCKTSK